METSERGLRMICAWEGFVPHVYKDVAGVETIGYGHALTAQEKTSRVFASGITQEQGLALCKSDIAPREAFLSTIVTVPLSQEQFDGLMSLVFNIGTDNFRHSTLLILLNQGNYWGAADEFTKWIKRRDPNTGKLVDDAGLLHRREMESNIFRHGTSTGLADLLERAQLQQIPARDFYDPADDREPSPDPLDEPPPTPREAPESIREAATVPDGAKRDGEA